MIRIIRYDSTPALLTGGGVGSILPTHPPQPPRMRSLPSTVAGMLGEARDHRRCPDVRWKVRMEAADDGNSSTHGEFLIFHYLSFASPPTLEPGFDPEGGFRIYPYLRIPTRRSECATGVSIYVDGEWIRPSPSSEDDDWDKY